MASIWGQILTGTQTVIKDLNLTGLPDAQVYKRFMVSTTNVKLPAVMVTIVDQNGTSGTEVFVRATNKSSDKGYPVFIYILAVNSLEDPDSTMDTYFEWREEMMNHFDHLGALTGLSTSIALFESEITPLASFVSQENVFVSPFMVNFTVREQSQT